MADKTGYIGRNPGDGTVTIARQSFTPSGITTEFTFTSGYTVGYFDLYINGVKMVEGSDYVSSNGSTFSVLNGGAVVGDVLEGIAYKAFNAASSVIGISSAGTFIGNANRINFVGTGHTFLLNGSSEIDISIAGSGSGGGGGDSTGVAGTFGVNATGIHTTKNVGIGTTTADGGADPANTSILNAGIVTANSFYGTFTGDVNGSASGLFGSPDIVVNNITGVGMTLTGVITYEDVTSVDSIGIVTARNGVSVLGAGITVTGISTFYTEVNVGTAITLDATSGIVSATSFYGDGANLTGLPASGVEIESSGSSLGAGVTIINFQSVTATASGAGATVTLGITTEVFTSSGIVTAVRLSNAQDHKITATGITTITSSGAGIEGESHTIRIVNSGIATVGFSTYFLFPSGSAPSLPTVAPPFNTEKVDPSLET